MDKKPYYRLLGLTEGATAAQIKDAYEKKMHKLRSDDYADDPEYVARKTREVRHAYSVLTGGAAPATRAQKEARFERWKDAQDGGEDAIREAKKAFRVGTSKLKAFGHDAVCDLEFEKEFCEHTKWDDSWAAPYTVDADPELIERIGKNDMVRGYTIAAVGFYAPQGRMVRLKLADPHLNEKIESFRFRGRPITNFEMESACLQGMAKMLGHKAMTVCCIIAQRRRTEADTDYKPHVAKLVETVLDRI